MGTRGSQSLRSHFSKILPITADIKSRLLKKQWQILATQSRGLVAKVKDTVANILINLASV